MGTQRNTKKKSIRVPLVHQKYHIEKTGRQTVPSQQKPGEHLSLMYCTVLSSEIKEPYNESSSSKLARSDTLIRVTLFGLVLLQIDSKT